MLEEKIKRSKTQNPSPTKPITRVASQEVVPEEVVPVMTASTPIVSKVTKNIPEAFVEKTSNVDQPFALELEKLRLPQLSDSSSTLPSVMAPTPAAIKVRPYSVSNSSEYLMDFLLAQITSGDAYLSVDALKKLEKTISDDPDLVKPQLNPMINAITLQIRLAFTSPALTTSESGSLVRLCKHLVNCLVQIFSNNNLALNLSKDTMHQLLAELLSRLMDPALASSGENGGQLIRALNVLMIRILENCSKNHVFR